MDLSKLSQGERIVLLAGVLLIIDLLFLPWHSFDVPAIAGGLGIDSTRSGVQSPNAFYGIVALVLVLVMVVQIVLDKLTAVELPSLPVPWSQVHSFAGITVALMLLVKLIAETEALGFGAFLGVLLGLAVAYGGYAIGQAHGRLTA